MQDSTYYVSLRDFHLQKFIKDGKMFDWRFIVIVMMFC